MKTMILFSTVILFCKVLIGQNLIVNSSFEKISKHDNKDLDMKYCSGWDISITTGISSSTPDHVFANDKNNYPQSSQGFMSAHTGNCFAGMTTNEYLITRLSNRLEKDSLYRISFWICLTPNSDYYVLRGLTNCRIDQTKCQKAVCQQGYPLCQNSYTCFHKYFLYKGKYLLKQWLSALEKQNNIELSTLIIE